jgi:putative hydrolase of the HAD superfamily
MIRAIGFDYEGVIEGLPSSFYDAAICELLHVSRDEYLAAYKNHHKRLNVGEITDRELWRLVLIDLGQPEKLDEVMAISKEYRSKGINQDVLDYIAKLRRSGYKTGLFSNNTRERGAQMREDGIGDYFDVLLVSAESGLRKPDAAAFEHFAKKLGVTSAELAFVDDTKGSLAELPSIGATPILYATLNDLARQLESLGVTDERRGRL